MKATEQYFPVVLLIMLYKVVLTFESMDEIQSVTIQMKAAGQYFPVVLLIMLYKVVLTFQSVDEIRKWSTSIKAVEQYQYFLIVLFVILHALALTSYCWLYLSAFLMAPTSFVC